MPRQSTAVIVWWVTLATLSVINLSLWALVARRTLRTGWEEDQDARVLRRRLLALSGLFIVGCAYRSFLPRVEGERFCLYDSWISNMALARAVATVAELALVAQWALLLDRWAREDGAGKVARTARLLVPMIALAEICSWYTTLTTNHFGAVIEESIWAATATLMTLSLVYLFTQSAGTRRTFTGLAVVLNAAYVVFMCTVDVPMYALRWRRDEARGAHYFTVWEGVRDSFTRWIVIRTWPAWREEIAWMTLYFTVGGWISLALVRAPLGRLRSPEGVSRLDEERP